MAIHAGKRVEPGGRYDRFLEFLRGHPGATTRDIFAGCGVCAVSTIASELRTLGYHIECRFERTTEAGARVHRYYLLETASQVYQRELFS